MNNFYQNQNQSIPENQTRGGASYGEAQLPAQANLSVERNTVQGQQGQEQKAVPQSSQQNIANNQQAAVLKASGRSNEITPEMKKTYESLFNSYGLDAANNWLKQQIVNSHINIQMDNEALIREVQSKYGDLYAVPIIREAIQAFVDMDLDPNLSLRDQGFHDAMEHMANIYRAGYEDALNLKNQNNSAKARMSSAVNSAVPHYQSNKIFTRSEIRTMSPDDFLRNEKTIFEQLGRGLIK